MMSRIVSDQIPPALANIIQKSPIPLSLQMGSNNCKRSAQNTLITNFEWLLYLQNDAFIVCIIYLSSTILTCNSVNWETEEKQRKTKQLFGK